MRSLRRRPPTRRHLPLLLLPLLLGSVGERWVRCCASRLVCIGTKQRHGSPPPAWGSAAGAAVVATVQRRQPVEHPLLLPVIVAVVATAVVGAPPGISPRQGIPRRKNKQRGGRGVVFYAPCIVQCVRQLSPGFRKGLDLPSCQSFLEIDRVHHHRDTQLACRSPSAPRVVALAPHLTPLSSLPH